MDRPFLVSATIDFPDDTQRIVYTENLLAQLIENLQSIGIRRVYWNYYQPGMWKMFGDGAPSTRASVENLGNPMAIASHIAHERGLEFYGVIKPYETGTSHATPARSPETGGRTGLARIGGTVTALDAWILEHPDLRVRARSGDILTDLADIPVTRVQLRQRDMMPIRIQAHNIEIWASSDNYGYKKLDIDFSFAEGVDVAPQDVFDGHGNLVTAVGDPVRTIELTGFRLLDPFIVITTNFDDDTGAFRNVVPEMIRAYGPYGQPLPIVVGCHKSIWTRPRDFRIGDLEFDSGHAFNVCLDVTNARQVCPHCRERGITDCTHMRIYADMPLCRDGLIGFAKGHNEYLPSAPCEAYSEVRDYWLLWIDDCISADVDGIDIRISNHACWTDLPDLYGFNQPIVDEYRRRFGTDPNTAPWDAQKIGTLRGEFYDQFLWAAKKRLATKGKRLQTHIEIESFEPGGPFARRVTRPGNILFNWRGWLRDHLADEVTVMAAIWDLEQVLQDPRGREAVDISHENNIPLYLRHYMWTSREGEYHANQLERVYHSGLFDGYNFYEAASMYDTRALSADGSLSFYPGMLEALRARIIQLGLG